MSAIPSGRLEIQVEENEAGDRLDRFLACRLPQISRTRLKNLIEEGCVHINDVVCASASARIKLDALIVVQVPELIDADPMPEYIPLQVVFEDAHLIVIDKQAGLVVHPAPGNWSGTLVNALLYHCGDSLSGIGGVKRPGIVHRLDKDTSGLMVIAKTDQAHQHLAAQFADHGRTGPLVRAYTAFVWGAPDRQAFTIDAPIDRDSKHRERMSVRKGGREAITHVTLEETYYEERSLPVVSRVICRLETGRTHQIRVHMSHVRHPLLGDGTYGAHFMTKETQLNEAARAALTALNRQALHACVLGFEHPVSEQPCYFESALPPDLEALRRSLL